MEYGSIPYDLVSQQQWGDIYIWAMWIINAWWNYTENYVEDILTVGDTDVYMWPFLGYLAQVELLYSELQHLV